MTREWRYRLGTSQDVLRNQQSTRIRATGPDVLRCDEATTRRHSRRAKLGQSHLNRPKGRGGCERVNKAPRDRAAALSFDDSLRDGERTRIKLWKPLKRNRIGQDDGNRHFVSSGQTRPDDSVEYELARHETRRKLRQVDGSKRFGNSLTKRIRTLEIAPCRLA